MALHRAANGNGQVVADYWQADEALRSRLREKYRAAGKNQRLEHPLGICRDRKLITEAEYLAGISYSQAHAAIEQQRREKSCLASVHQSGGTVAAIANPEAEAKREGFYLAARKALQSAGIRAFLQVQAVALYGHAPEYLYPHTTRIRGDRRNDAREHEALRHGLAALLTVYRHREGEDDVQPVP